MGLSLPKVAFITLEKYNDGDMQQTHAGFRIKKYSDYSIKRGRSSHPGD